MTFGTCMEKLFRVLARGKRLRGTWFDVFGYGAERKTERRLARQYRETVLTMLDKLDGQTFPVALEFAALPDMILGFGHIKQASIERYDAELQRNAQAWRSEERRVGKGCVSKGRVWWQPLDKKKKI